MLVGFSPFTGYDTRSLAQNLRKGDYAVPKNIQLSVSCFDFIDKCLKSDPKKRIKHDQLLEHTFLQPEEGSEVINLEASMIGASPFSTPSSVNQLNEQNSYKLNVNESTLFNEEISKQITKYYSKQDAQFQEEEKQNQQKSKEAIKEMEDIRLKITQHVPDANVSSSEEEEKIEPLPQHGSDSDGGEEGGIVLNTHENPDEAS